MSSTSGNPLLLNLKEYADFPPCFATTPQPADGPIEIDDDDEEEDADRMYGTGRFAGGGRRLGGKIRF